MRTIINNQKKERDILLSRPYLTRHTQYDVDELLASKQIKLITGPRRTGKSTEALLMLKGRNFAYLNFDDGKLLSAWDDDLVWETLRAVYPDFEYLLLDEVQNLDGWDLWVSKLYRMGINMVITGSNATEPVPVRSQEISFNEKQTVTSQSFGTNPKLWKRTFKI